ncbi:hypothetical protein [Leptospira kanakyensis]|uniref:hypothetical protein n=1 Tax=Leptospira kanakyensis TaxID=2484968 RepID=UPI00223DE7CA|nr:hypothetical protein [Leptospira kanakyensis]MCW7480728.1 hypothetical protein [Leptospira kanakyensis]
MSLPESEKQIIETNLQWLVSLRKAAIDEAIRRGKSYETMDDITAVCFKFCIL